MNDEAKMLTIFAVPKAFRGHIEIIQRNAIRSWTRIQPRPEILLLGDDPGTEQVAREFGLRHCPDIERNEFGTPLLSDIFDRAAKEATNNLLCYVNSDIIFPTTLSETIAKIRFKKFVIIGQRWDLDNENPVDFEDPKWEQKLNDRRKAEAKLHEPTGIDYFIYPRGCYENILPFALGRGIWDNWLVFRGRLSAIPVIDATRMITVIHQNHDYGSGPEDAKWICEGPERQANLELAGGYSSAFTIDDTNFVILPEGLKRRGLTKKRLDREMHLLAKRHTWLAFGINFFWKILKRIDRWFSKKRTIHNATG